MNPPDLRSDPEPDIASRLAPRGEPPAIRSTATIMGHPIHPMLVPFPMAFLIGALLSDLGYLLTGDLFWATASLWLIGAGIFGGLAAGVAGAMDYLGDGRVRALRSATLHAVGNVVALVLATAGLWMRLDGGAAETVWPWGVALSLVIVALLGFTGWLGGELSYRHRVGVMDAETLAEHPSAETAETREPTPSL